jgi:hypothetical protein
MPISRALLDERSRPKKNQVVAEIEEDGMVFTWEM